MKLNFWQWLGVALLILGVIWLIWREKNQPAATKSSFAAPVQASAQSAAPAAVGAL